MKCLRNLTFDQFMECNWQLASGFESTSSVFIFLNHILKHKTLANTDLFATMTLSLKVSQRVYFWNLILCATWCFCDFVAILCFIPFGAD